jgi:hypothetical protein
MWDGLMADGKVFDYAQNGSQGATTMISYGSYPGYLFLAGGSQINFGSGASIDNIFDGGGSFSGWLKPLGRGAGGYGRVFDKSTNTTMGTLLYCDDSDTTMRFIQITDTDNGEWTFPLDITSGIWQHVVIAYDNDLAANNPSIYVNGQSVVATEDSTPNDTRTSDATAKMYIGQKAAGGRSWDGYMDDLMFFNRILSALEARSIYEVTRSRYGV